MCRRHSESCWTGKYIKKNQYCRQVRPERFHSQGRMQKLHWQKLYRQTDKGV